MAAIGTSVSWSGRFFSRSLLRMKRQLLYLAAAVLVGLQAPSAFAQCESCGEGSSCSKCDKCCKCTTPPCDSCPDCSDPCCHRWHITVSRDCSIDKLIE